MQEYSTFVREFETRFDAFLQQTQRNYIETLTHPDIQQYLELIPSLAQGGKRVRPYVAWISTGVALDDLTQDHWNVFIALENIHLFALIHDDLMDQSPERRGIPTAHTSITSILESQKAIGDTAFSGRMQALLLGDLVFWATHDLLISHPQNQELSPLFSKLINNTILGQMLDFDQTNRATVSSEDVLTKTIHKTSYYTFSYPIQIGLQLSSTTTNIDVFRLGKLIGLGFQTQDDLLDVIGDPQKTKKPVMADVSSGQHTLMTSYIERNGTAEQRSILQKYRRNSLAIEAVGQLRTMFINSGAVAHAKEAARAAYNEALQEINASDLKEKTKVNLTALVNYLKEREY